MTLALRRSINYALLPDPLPLIPLARYTHVYLLTPIFTLFRNGPRIIERI